MNLIRSFLGRRQFLTAFVGSSLLLIFRKVSKALDQISRKNTAHALDVPGSLEKRSLKGIVLYYSATGNTGKIAGAIYRGMRSIIACDVASIKKISPKDIAKYDVIAIGGPVWHFREPANLKLFIYNMRQMPGKFGVLFCTHGPNPDGIFYGLENSLREKGVTVIGWNDWYGGSYINLHSPKPAPTDGHPDDIDLREAEIFGREMAERANRIYYGERYLVPEIPAGPDAGSLWTPRFNMPIGEVSGDEADIIPIIDTKKCIYPRCTACVDNCVANAIDLSVAAPAGKISQTSIFIKGCLHCSHAFCIRSCVYDAISYQQFRQNHKIDMTKCIYPECTLCADHCPMDSIDLSCNPPIFHENCEGCDLCTGLCPVAGAIMITNFEEIHGGSSSHSADIDPNVYKGFYSGLNEAKAIGKFRPLVPISEIGFDTPLSTVKRVPLFVRNEGDFPYYINE